ncbi:MAG: hypothetical protein LC749_20585 [Actinobacteria bacterium]|nr:hypothetical protein [Actinomycetota bacterium]
MYPTREHARKDVTRYIEFRYKQQRAYEQQDEPLRHGFTSCSAGRTT